MNPGLLFHPNRGGEFTSNDFTDDVKAIQARHGLSRPGECYDNASMESLFVTLKDETDIDQRRVFASPEHTRTIIGEYIERFLQSREETFDQQLPESR